MDVEDNELEFLSITGYADPVIPEVIAWHTDGTRLFACGDDGKVKTYDTTTGEMLFEFRLPEGFRRLAFDPTARFLAYSPPDFKSPEIALWNLATQPKWPSAGHVERLKGLPILSPAVQM
jgi:WD40 repeat protein